MFETSKSVLRVAARARRPMSLILSPPRSPTCVILGNGPSLAADIQPHLHTLRKMDLFCVNQFAESELFEELKPKYYVVADPSYWLESEPAEVRLLTARAYERIIAKTSWPLTLYAPFQAKKRLVASFADAPNVRVVFYNNIPITGARQVAYRLYRLGLGSPHVQNVLVAALFLALRIQYQNIILLGADHSWHQTLALDSLNRVCVTDKHFYDTAAALKPFGEGKFNMATLFMALAKMFQGYMEIEEYAGYIGARICNASSSTFIDAFTRRPLADALMEFSNSAKLDAS